MDQPFTAPVQCLYLVYIISKGYTKTTINPFKMTRFFFMYNLILDLYFGFYKIFPYLLNRLDEIQKNLTNKKINIYTF